LFKGSGGGRQHRHIKDPSLRVVRQAPGDALVQLRSKQVKIVQPPFGGFRHLGDEGDHFSSVAEGKPP
jgi:hypothetical protein